MSTRAKPQKSTHTHTHTHTDSLITSLKQIGTICLTISLFTIPNFTFATNIPTTNPGCTTTVLGADNVANRSAALEPDFHANTINTTWYSNGEQLTGNNIPGTCTYDAALTPPTPAARPGYVFNGWTLRVSNSGGNGGEEPQQQCLAPSVLIRTEADDYRYVNAYDVSSGNLDNNSWYSFYNVSGPSENNTWACGWDITGSFVVFGEAVCAASSDEYGAPDLEEMDGINTMDPYLSMNCYCHATGYSTSGTRCNFVSSNWVIGDMFTSSCPDSGDPNDPSFDPMSQMCEYYAYDSCQESCAQVCAGLARGQPGGGNNYYLEEMLTGLIAQ